MKNYVFVGAVEFSARCLRALLEMNVNIQEIMCPIKTAAAGNSDYFDLGAVAREFGREVRYFSRIKDEAGHIRSFSPDVVFVLGLSQIVPKEILDIPSIGCLGSHPALLPRNRGRHPIIWALANGLEKSGVTLFWLDEGVDSGDIWAQREFHIDITDDALSVYEKVTRLSVEMLREGVPAIEDGVVKRTPQDHALANHWRKRGKKDGEIDWRMSSKRIYDLVRAITRPYPGAHCLYRGNEARVWKTRLVTGSWALENIEPGKVVTSNDGFVRVKTGDGLIDLIEHELTPVPDAGEYL